MARAVNSVEKDAPIRRTLSTKQIEEQYGISERTTRTWIATGKLKAYKVAGSLVRVRVEDLEGLFIEIGGGAA